MIMPSPRATAPLEPVAIACRRSLPADTLRAAPPPAGNEGFALLVVVWILALIALSFTALSTSTTSLIRGQRALVARDQAQMLADGGVNLAILDLIRRDLDAGKALMPLGDKGHVCQLPDQDFLQIEIRDESGKVDLNTASDDLLRALFIGSGTSVSRASQLVDAILDYRDDDDDKRPSGAERAEYLAAGRAGGPKNAAFDSVVEAADVLGLDIDLYRAIRPHLTVHSQLTGIDPKHASLALLSILAKVSAGSTSAPPGLDPEDLIARLSPRFIASSTGQAFEIRAISSTINQHRFDRRAIVLRQAAAARAPLVKLEDNQSRPRPHQRSAAANALAPTFQIVEWDRGGIGLSPLPPDAQLSAVPGC